MTNLDHRSRRRRRRRDRPLVLHRPAGHRRGVTDPDHPRRALPRSVPPNGGWLAVRRAGVHRRPGRRSVAPLRMKFGFAIPGVRRGGRRCRGGRPRGRGRRVGLRLGMAARSRRGSRLRGGGEPLAAVPRADGGLCVGTRRDHPVAVRHRRPGRAVPPSVGRGRDGGHPGPSRRRPVGARRRHRLPARRVRGPRRRLRRPRRARTEEWVRAVRQPSGRVLGRRRARAGPDLDRWQQRQGGAAGGAAGRRLAPALVAVRGLRRRAAAHPRDPERRRHRRRRSRSRSAPGSPSSPTGPRADGRRRWNARRPARSSAMHPRRGPHPTGGRASSDRPTI